MRKMTHEQMIQRATSQLMNAHQFRSLTGIFMLGTNKIADTPVVPTAATNGLDCVYNPVYIDTLSEKQVAFVVLHERLHISYRHLYTWRHLAKQDQRRANAAMDYQINLAAVLADPNGEVVVPPPGLLLDHKYAGMHVGEIFDLLKSEGRGGEGDEGGEDPFDSHLWDEAEQMTEQEQQEITEAVDRALRQGTYLSSKMGEGNVLTKLLDIPKPKVDWREQLHEFWHGVVAGKDLSTWSRISRRGMAMGVPTPHTYSEQAGRVVVAVDTSGSIGMNELSQFIAEIVSLLETTVPEGLTLLYWDTHVAGVEHYDPSTYPELKTSTRPKGGGGTAPSCVKQWLDSQPVKPTALVLLSDGYVGGDFPEFGLPTVWVMTSDVVAPNAVTINI
jgi:predicted metal-dependent peptidase